MEVVEAQPQVQIELGSQIPAMADSVDMLNFTRLFFADFLHPEGIDLRRPDEALRLLPEAIAITDCKSLHDALEKNESLGLGLSENEHQLKSRPRTNR